jgi:acyl-CoA thioesterase I
MSSRNVVSLGVVVLIVVGCVYTAFRKMGGEAPRNLQPHSDVPILHAAQTIAEKRVQNSADIDTTHRQVLGQLCSLRKPISILCIGDSITYGNGSHVRRKERDHEGNYPVALEKHLRAACNSNNGITVTNLGSSGRTLLDGFKQSFKNTSSYKSAVKLAASAHVIMIMLGTNDSKPRHWKSKEAFAAALVALVEHFSALNEKLKFVLMTPPPSFPDPRVMTRMKKRSVLGNIRPVIIRNEIRMAVMSAAELTGADVIDIFGEFDTMDDLHSLGQLEDDKVEHRSIEEGEWLDHIVPAIQQYFHDGVHPTLASHEYIATILAHELTSAA